MKIPYRFPLARAAAAAALILCATSTQAGNHHGSRGPAALPGGFDGFAVYTMDGEFDVAAPNPLVPDCAFNLCDGTYFWEQVIHAPSGVREASEAEAKAFMLERFGLDIDALVANGDIIWLDRYLDPRMNYRARVVAGERVHRLGWEVHDQFFIAIANTALTLGGEFAGEVAPAGTNLLFGQYAIEKSRLRGRRSNPRVVSNGEFLRIRYQSGSPVLPPGLDRIIAFSCEITASPWGTGRAQGVGAPIVLGDGLAPGSFQKQNLRNVLTFGGTQGAGRFPGVYNW